MHISNAHQHGAASSTLGCATPEVQAAAVQRGSTAPGCTGFTPKALQPQPGGSGPSLLTCVAKGAADHGARRHVQVAAAQAEGAHRVACRVVRYLQHLPAGGLNPCTLQRPAGRSADGESRRGFEILEEQWLERWRQAGRGRDVSPMPHNIRQGLNAVAAVAAAAAAISSEIGSNAPVRPVVLCQRVHQHSRARFWPLDVQAQHGARVATPRRCDPAARPGRPVNMHACRELLDDHPTE